MRLLSLIELRRAFRQNITMENALTSAHGAITIFRNPGYESSQGIGNSGSTLIVHNV